MKPEKIRVYFVTGYNGAVKAGVYIDEKDYVLDTDYLKSILENQIEEKGYTTSQSKRQKYPRLTINR